MVDLDRLVSENRFTISIVFPVMGALGFLASAEGILPDFLRFNPFLILFGTLVMRLPLISGLKPIIDRRALAGISLLTAYTYIIEFVGLKTGLPYGEFTYLETLGPVVYGVPIGLPIFFIPLVLNAYLLGTLLKLERWRKLFFALIMVIGIDLVLDPAAVALGIWSYGGGFFYGVPVSNFLGWVLSGSIAIITLKLSFNDHNLSERISEVDYILDDFVSFQILWGAVNLYYVNIVPLLIVLGNILLLYRAESFSLAFEDYLEKGKIK